MKSRAILGTFAILFVLPSFAVAQNGGFVPGINRGWVHPVSPAVTGRIVQPFGTVRSHNVFVTPGQHVPGIHVVPHAPVVLVPAPTGSRVAPGTERTASKRGRRTPRLSVGQAVGHGGFGRVPRRHPQTTFIPNAPGTFISVPNHGRPHSAGGTIFVGMPRADVLLHLGRPHSTILARHNETLVFTGTTVVIQNGVVAVIR